MNLKVPLRCSRNLTRRPSPPEKALIVLEVFAFRNIWLKIPVKVNASLALGNREGSEVGGVCLSPPINFYFGTLSIGLNKFLLFADSFFVREILA